MPTYSTQCRLSLFRPNEISKRETVKYIICSISEITESNGEHESQFEEHWLKYRFRVVKGDISDDNSGVNDAVIGILPLANEREKDSCGIEGSRCTAWLVIQLGEKAEFLVRKGYEQWLAEAALPPPWEEPVCVMRAAESVKQQVGRGRAFCSQW